MCHLYKMADAVSNRKSKKKTMFVYELLTNVRDLFSFISQKRWFIKNRKFL
jgi:hypothetical protein